MAKDKLWVRYLSFASMWGFIISAFIGCVVAHSEPTIGMSLVFISNSKEPVLVKRFDPDGIPGPVPGWLGSKGGEAHMTFMPSDDRGGMPMFVDIEWSEVPPDAAAAVNKVPKQKSNQSAAERAVITQALEQAYTLYRPHRRRVDLTSVIPSELVAQVRANRSTTNLKLIVTFNGSEVTIEAKPEKWR